MKYLTPLLLIILVSACSPTFKTSGNYLRETQIEEAEVGMSKQEIRDKFGPPSAFASFKENTWYYIYERSQKKLSFLDKQIIDSKVIIIKFDADNVSEIEVKTLEDRNNIPFDEQQTPNFLQKVMPYDESFRELNIFK